MNGDMKVIVLLIPLILIELGLMVSALYDLVRRKKVRGGNKLVWGAAVVFVGVIGPVLYFLLGREEE